MIVFLYKLLSQKQPEGDVDHLAFPDKHMPDRLSPLPDSRSHKLTKHRRSHSDLGGIKPQRGRTTPVEPCIGFEASLQGLPSTQAEHFNQKYGEFEGVPLQTQLQCYFLHREHPDQLAVVQDYMRDDFLVENDFFDPSIPEDRKRFMMFCVANFPDLAAKTFLFEEERSAETFGNRMKIVATYYCWLFIHDDFREATGILDMSAVKRMNDLLDVVFDYVSDTGKDDGLDWSDQPGWKAVLKTHQFKAVLKHDCDEAGPGHRAIALAFSLFKVATRLAVASGDGRNTIAYFKETHLKYTGVNTKETLCRELGLTMVLGTVEHPNLDPAVGWLPMREANSAVSPCVAVVAKLAGVGDCSDVVTRDPVVTSLPSAKLSDDCLRDSGSRVQILEGYQRKMATKGIAVDTKTLKRLEAKLMQFTPKDIALGRQEQRSEWVISVENCLASAGKETRGEESGNTVFTAFIGHLSDHLQACGVDFKQFKFCARIDNLVDLLKPQPEDLDILEIEDDALRSATLKKRAEAPFVKMRRAVLQLIFCRMSEKPLMTEADIRRFFMDEHKPPYPKLTAEECQTLHHFNTEVSKVTVIGESPVVGKQCSFGHLMQAAFDTVTTLRADTIENFELASEVRAFLVRTRFDECTEEAALLLKKAEGLEERQRLWMAGHPFWTFRSIRYIMYGWGGEASQKEKSTALKKDFLRKSGDLLDRLAAIKAIKEKLKHMGETDKSRAPLEFELAKSRSDYLEKMCALEAQVEKITQAVLATVRD